MTKLLIASCITLFISPVFAQDLKQETLETAKKELTAHIDSVIAEHQTFKTCVGSAKDQESLKTCRKAHHEQMKKLHAEHKEDREDFKKEVKEKMKEKREHKKHKKEEQ